MLRPHKISGCCLLGIIVVGALAPGVGWGEPTAVDRADSGQQGEHHEPTAPRQHRGIAARPPAPSSVLTRPRQSAYRPGGAVAAKPMAGNPVPASASLTRRAITARPFSAKPPSTNITAGVSGNAMGRRTSGSPALAGLATYDARKGALISGSAIRPRF